MTIVELSNTRNEKTIVYDIPYVDVVSSLPVPVYQAIIDLMKRYGSTGVTIKLRLTPEIKHLKLDF